MNYQRIHDQIIQRAKLRGVIKNKHPDFERHHVIPKSMGGTNKKNNLVDLTPREHFVIHHLLMKIHRNHSMAYAFNMMCHTRKLKITSFEYEAARKACLQSNVSLAYQMGKKNKGRSMSVTTKAKQSARLKGKPQSASHIAARSKSMTGKPHPHKGRVYTDEQKLISSVKFKNQIPWQVQRRIALTAQLLTSWENNF